MNAHAKIKIVNMLEAKTHLSRLVDAVERGEQAEVIIARNGKPSAKLVPIAPKKQVKLIGVAKGKFNIDWEAWDAQDAEIAKLFYDSKLFPDGE